MKIFLSYSHNDDIHLSDFLTHSKPITDKHNAKVWWDRCIQVGENLYGTIENEQLSSNLCILFISSHYLASKACVDEKTTAFEMLKKGNTKVFPIILESCQWLIDDDIPKILVAPTDGKPINEFPSPDKAWFDVINKLNSIITSLKTEKYTRKHKINDEFLKYIESADILSNSIGKEELKLEDIYVYPKLKHYKDKENLNENLENIIDNLDKYNRMIFAGENQAGKTTLCKKIYREIFKLDLHPILLKDFGDFHGDINQKLENASIEQYGHNILKQIKNNKLAIIIDNFHEIKNKQKVLKEFKKYSHVLITVDDIYGLDIENQDLIGDFEQFRILEFSPIERDQLIRKWINLKEKDKIELNQNEFFQSLDEKTEMIEQSLGVIFGKGIMPSYPFFIISLLASQQFIGNTISQEITSQGHCYQALITLYLSKEGVKPNDIDTYINFITEFAKYLWTNKKNRLPKDEFLEFFTLYKDEYILTEKPEILLKTLKSAHISSYDSFNNYCFNYEYIYYFFVAKYISDNISLESKSIERLLNNLHLEENAYITVFITHHSKSDILLDQLKKKCENLFNNHNDCRLDKTEMTFIDTKDDFINAAILPNVETNVNQERRKKLELKSKEETLRKSNNEVIDDDFENELSKNLRSSIKSLEVLGLIIKNRSGSLPKNKLTILLKSGISLQLRVLSSFIELINNNDGLEHTIENMIIDKIKYTNEERLKNNQKKLSEDKIRTLARTLYWNINFDVIRGMLSKAIHSLGSNKLTPIVKSIYNEDKTSAKFLIYQGINMWYNKNVNIDEIIEFSKDKNNSDISVKILKHKIVDHIKFHKIDIKRVTEIGQKLNIPISTLISIRNNPN